VASGIESVLDEHWQRAAAADPPQPIEHCDEQQQDRQRAQMA
jgi:hypothetical protein